MKRAKQGRNEWPSQIATRPAPPVPLTISRPTRADLADALFVYQRALERIGGMAGDPDAARGCRNIIALARETLG